MDLDSGVQLDRHSHLLPSITNPPWCRVEDHSFSIRALELGLCKKGRCFAEDFHSLASAHEPPIQVPSSAEVRLCSSPHVGRYLAGHHGPICVTSRECNQSFPRPRQLQPNVSDADLRCPIQAVPLAHGPRPNICFFFP